MLQDNVHPGALSGYHERSPSSLTTEEMNDMPEPQTIPKACAIKCEVTLLSQGRVQED